MNLTPITKAIIPAVFALSACGTIDSSIAAPTHDRIIEYKSDTVTTKVFQNDELDTEVKVDHQGNDLAFSFSKDQLKDKAYIESTLSPLPEKARKEVTELLERLDNKEVVTLVLDDEITTKSLSPEQEKKLKAKLAKLEKQLSQKVAKIEANARKMESKAREIEIKVLKEMEGLELEELNIELDIDNITDQIHDVAMQLHDIHVEKLGSDHQFIVIKDKASFNGDIAEYQTQQVIKLIDKNKLSEEQKQAIREALK